MGDTPAVHAFGPFRFDWRQRRLERDGAAVVLGRRALEVLGVLLAADGAVVSKDRLLAAAWPGLTVDENNLQVQVSALRKALGDGWIVTVSGEGYRIAGGPPGDARPEQGHPRLPSIAVQPFADLAGDSGQAFFADGTTEEIIHRLSHSRPLMVIARNSSFAYKGRAIDVRAAGRELGVRYLLEGSVRRDGDRLRVGAALLDAESGGHVWSAQYDRAVNDIFAVQDEIAAAVAMAIEPAIGAAELRRIARQPLEALGAWEAYQRGVWHLTKNNAEDLAQARLFFERALRLDPGFARAYAEMAWVLIYEAVSFSVRPLREGYVLAFEMASRALALDPLEAEAHAALSMTSFVLGSPADVAFHYEQATAINPNSARARRGRAIALLFSGHPTEARALLHDVLRLNPQCETAAAARSHITISHYLDGDYAGAVDAARTAIAAHPGFPWAYRWLAAALGQLGQAEAAAAALRRAIEVSPGNFDRIVESRPPWSRPEDHEAQLDGLRKAGWRGGG